MRKLRLRIYTPRPTMAKATAMHRAARAKERLDAQLPPPPVAESKVQPYCPPPPIMTAPEPTPQPVVMTAPEPRAATVVVKITVDTAGGVTASSGSSDEPQRIPMASPALPPPLQPSQLTHAVPAAPAVLPQPSWPPQWAPPPPLPPPPHPEAKLAGVTTRWDRSRQSDSQPETAWHRNKRLRSERYNAKPKTAAATPVITPLAMCLRCRKRQPGSRCTFKCCEVCCLVTWPSGSCAQHPSENLSFS